MWVGEQGEGRQGQCLFWFVLVGLSLSIEWKDYCLTSRTRWGRILLPSAIRLGVPGTTGVPGLAAPGRLLLGTPPEDRREQYEGAPAKACLSAPGFVLLHIDSHRR